MIDSGNEMSNVWKRRDFLKGAAMAWAAGRSGRAAERVLLFDGKTLSGWMQSENSAISLATAGITDPAAFVNRLIRGTDPLSAYLRGRLTGPLLQSLSAASPQSDEFKAALSALVKEINPVLAGPSLYDAAGKPQLGFRPETRRLLQGGVRGLDLARLNKLVLEDGYPAELARSATTGWVVKDGAMASTGSGRGVIYTAGDYGRFRLSFTMRHVSGNPDHQACVLIFCTRPGDGEKPLDALAGIQFQVPNGGHWDYRPGKNNNGGDAFTQVAKPGYDPHQWSSVEILADSSQGTARMAVAQPPGAGAVEVLRFKDPAAGRSGPIAWQMHNAGLFDEYKDAAVEIEPQEDRLLSVK